MAKLCANLAVSSPRSLRGEGQPDGRMKTRKPHKNKYPFSAHSSTYWRVEALLQELSTGAFHVLPRPAPPQELTQWSQPASMTEICTETGLAPRQRLAGMHPQTPQGPGKSLQTASRQKIKRQCALAPCSASFLSRSGSLSQWVSLCPSSSSGNDSNRISPQPESQSGPAAEDLGLVVSSVPAGSMGWAHLAEPQFPQCKMG